MLGHLRRRAEQILERTHRALLSTCGPAEIQTSGVECVVVGLRLYVTLPCRSEHLDNLEASSSVVLTAPGVQIRGDGRVRPPGASVAGVPPPDGTWCALVEIVPTRIHLLDDDGEVLETLDVSADVFPRPDGAGLDAGGNA